MTSRASGRVRWPGPEIDAKGVAEGGIVVGHVSKAYRGRSATTAALDDVSITVPRGKFVSVVGPSGCGKSTLLRIVAGLSEPSQGNVMVNGERPAVIASRKQIGFVPQSPALLPWLSVLENVSLPLALNRKADVGRPARQRTPKEVLEALGLGAWLAARPGELSGGMRQRVSLARAFALDPAVLLMDEPFSSLDEITREVLCEALLELWEADRKTVLFVTHSLAEASVLSDEVVVLGGPPGRVVARIAVPLGRPRQASDHSELVALQESLRLALRGGARLADRSAER